MNQFQTHYNVFKLKIQVIVQNFHTNYNVYKVKPCTKHIMKIWQTVKKKNMDIKN